VIYACELKVLSVVRNELRRAGIEEASEFAMRETTDKLIVLP
jgi:hypothetical protein